MKKFWAIIVSVAMVLTVALSGCGTVSSTEAPAAEAAKTEEAAPAAEAAAPAAEAAAPAAEGNDETEIAVVVKVAGIDWFNTMGTGVDKAAADFGVNAYLTGPAEADAALQVTMIEDLITKGVDAIVVVPTDVDALESAFAKAKAAGIPVITNESPNMGTSDFDYEMINYKETAHLVMDSIAEQCGGKGGYAQLVGGLTVPLHNMLADELTAYQKEKYPDMFEVTDRQPTAESIQDSYDATVNMMKAYDDLAAVIGWGSQGPIGAAQAVTDEDKIGKVTVTGLVMPGQSKEYLENGSLLTGYLWNPEDAGYFGVYGAIAALNGEVKDGATIKVPNSDMSAVVNGNVIGFDGLLTFTTDTVDNYNF